VHALPPVRFPDNLLVEFPNRYAGRYNPKVSTEFLDHLASQLKIGKDPASRRAIVRILDIIKKCFEDGQYQDRTEAERAFRQLVEGDENSK
jgi:hypothetical protein